jgi:hypothetical protein
MPRQITKLTSALSTTLLQNGITADDGTSAEGNQSEPRGENAEADRKAAQEDILAKMDANQAKAGADRVQMQEMMMMLQAYQAKTDAVLPAMQVTETSRKETAATFKPETEVKTMACQEMEAHQREEEPTSAERKPEAAKQREVPAENATVMPVGEPKKNGGGT